MESESSDFIERPGADRHWYDLFSRGARDWLRHNDKVRSAVREKLPELIANSDVMPRADSTSTAGRSDSFPAPRRIRGCGKLGSCG